MLVGNGSGPLYVSFTKNMPGHYRMYNQIWLKIVVPASAVSRTESKRDGSYGIITDINAIESVDYSD